MKTIALTAPSSLAGSMIYNVLKDKYRFVLIGQSNDELVSLEHVYGESSKQKSVVFDLSDLYLDYAAGFPNMTAGLKAKKIIEEIGEIDAIINCASIIKPYISQDPFKALFINAGLPHVLSHYYGDRLIHIATDCVFDGLSGAPYNENSLHHPTDAYGFSRSLGEPVRRSLVLRASLVGPEIEGSDSLVSWLKKNEGRAIQGFTNHVWNGLTTREFALICHEIISHRDQYSKTGLFHLFSSAITKYEMLVKFKEKYKINVNIKPTASTPIDRRLKTIYDVCKKLKISSFDQMLEEL
ncbi:MAG: sugar nucleotide-binding protein [Patescibacteria group bacterium]